MSHYFSENNNTLKSNPQEIAFRVNGIPLKFKTDTGVFSKDNFDRGTKVLLKFFRNQEGIKDVLDLGCGYGVVGIYLNKVYNHRVDMVDINERAVLLTNENIRLNDVEGHCFKSDGFTNIDKKYDIIITNPPIRVGKKKMFELLTNSKSFLTENGELTLVINKKHGAASALTYLKTIYRSVEILGRDKGFNVILCKK